jgi:glycosyltransferase involved in cell wall biosynthesis
VAEVLEDGISGVLVAPDSARELARGIGSLLDDPALAARVAAGAREAARRHTWSGRAAAVLDGLA